MVSSKKKKVCVVGTGISGLASARELLREGHAATVMEQSSGVGGQWLYDPMTDAGDPLGTAGVHSSIYSSVRLIIPREVTGFSGFPFYPRSDGGGGDRRRYPCHGEFLRYIRDFCDALFGITDVVRFNTRVVRVAVAPPPPPPPSDDDDDGRSTMRWMVRWMKPGEVAITEEEEEEEEEEEWFDAVVVAVGQYTHPRLPTINGMDKWKGRQLHYSHSYRTASPTPSAARWSSSSAAARAARTSRWSSATWRGRCTSASKSMGDDGVVTPGVSKGRVQAPQPARLHLHLHLQAWQASINGNQIQIQNSKIIQILTQIPRADRMLVRGRPGGVRRRRLC
jgi:hypothetical protein